MSWGRFLAVSPSSPHPRTTHALPISLHCSRSGEPRSPADAPGQPQRREISGCDPGRPWASCAESLAGARAGPALPITARRTCGTSAHPGPRPAPARLGVRGWGCALGGRAVVWGCERAGGGAANGSRGWERAGRKVSQGSGRRWQAWQWWGVKALGAGVVKGEASEFGGVGGVRARQMGLSGHPWVTGGSSAARPPPPPQLPPPPAVIYKGAPGNSRVGLSLPVARI